MATRRKAPTPRASIRFLLFLYGAAALLIFGAAAALSTWWSDRGEQERAPPGVARSNDTGEPPPQASIAPEQARVDDGATDSRFLYVPNAKLMTPAERAREENKNAIAQAVAKVEVDNPACRTIARNSAVYCEHMREKKGFESGGRCEEWMEERIAACNSGDTDPGVRTDF